MHRCGSEFVIVKHVKGSCCGLFRIIRSLRAKTPENSGKVYLQQLICEPVFEYGTPMYKVVQI